MEKSKLLLRRTYDHLMHDSLRRNSTLLILSQAVLAGSLFLFFVINAHLFPAASVGLASSFISFGLLVATFTNLGLPNTIIRFLSGSNRKVGLFTAALGLVTLVSLLGGVVAVLLLPHLVPRLGFVRSSSLLSLTLILLISGTAVSALLDGTLVAFRKGEYVFARAVITNAPRIVLPFFVISAGLKAMTGIYVGTLLVGVAFNLYVIFRRLLVSQKLRPTLAEVREHRSYASSNYFGGLFGVLPSTLVPIIVLSRLGPTAAAYYYMPAQIALFLSVVCNAISQAFISEASQTSDDEEHKKIFRKVFIHQYRLLVPLIALLCLLAWPILRLYGRAYVSHGFVPLLILAVSALVVGLNWLGDTWLNVKKRSRDYFLMNAFNSLATLVAVYIFSKHGLVAAALGWLIGQCISAAVYLIIFARGQLLSFVTGFKPSS
jgi:O-antigen/teichoic acid export membrane protein